ncbi:MAG: response regulator [Gammaproteobacteria bacterium]|jgi:two-component system response regulator RegA|nr:response regulator [Gammaproteobacteria bacterium]MDH5171711.1 response regulator [Gammaproteobacteria bacterium]
MTETAGKILLVDDDPVFTGVMARGFRRRGFTTRSCATAEAALAACREFRPSHILLDLNMPGTSGLVILPRLLAASPGAALVVLTGYSSIVTAVEATRAGATNYLCKPATIDEILSAFAGDAGAAPAAVPSDPISVERLEWEHIQRVLQDCAGNVSATARALGMHRRTLQRKLQKRPVRR